MRLRSCLVHGLDGASPSKALSSQGPGAFFFSSPAMCISVGPPSRGAILQLTASPLKAATITYESWQLHLLERFSFSTFQRPSCLLGCVLTAPCRNAMQDNWLAAGDQI